jgi:DNA-directed RNA polymerase specialized sigma subunit
MHAALPTEEYFMNKTDNFTGGRGAAGARGRSFSRTKEEVVEAVDAFTARHGRLPYSGDIAAVLGVTTKTVRKYCRKYGVRLPKRSPPGGKPPAPQPLCAKEEFVAAADAFAAEHGRLPVINELAAVLGVSWNTIINYKKRYGVKLPRKMMIKPILFTKEELTARRDAFAAEHGRLPAKTELAASLGVNTYALSGYLRKYGLEYRVVGPLPRYTKKVFLAKIDAFAAEHGRPPSRRELMAVLGVSKETVYSYLRIYGGSLYRKNASIPYTKEEVVAAVDAFTAEHGRLPNKRRELASILGLSNDALSKYCRKYGISLPIKNTYRRYTKEEVVAAVDAFTAEHGRLPYSSDIAAVLGVSMPTVYRYLVKYGVSLPSPDAICRYTKEEVVAAVDAFAARRGRPPTRRELTAVLGVSTSAVRDYCLKYGIELPRKTN